MTKPIQNDPAREYAEAQIAEQTIMLASVEASIAKHSEEYAIIERQVDALLVEKRRLTALRDQAQAFLDAAALPPKAAPKPDRVKPGAIPEAILAALKQGGSPTMLNLAARSGLTRDQLSPALRRMIKGGQVVVDAGGCYRAVSPPIAPDTERSA